MRLVHDDEAVVEGAAAHEGQRSDFDHIALEHLVHALGLQQVVERVVERAQIGVDLFLESAGQEAEALACFDRGAHQHDAANLLGQQGSRSHGDGEIGLARAGGADAEDHVGLLDSLDVMALIERTRLDHALNACGALLAAFGQGAEGDRRIGRHQAQHAVQLAVLEQNSLASQRFVVLENALDAGDGFVGPLDHDGIGYQIDARMESILHQSQIFVAGPEQGLKIGCDLEMFSHQVRKKPPNAARRTPRG